MDSLKFTYKQFVEKFLLESTEVCDYSRERGRNSFRRLKRSVRKTNEFIDKKKKNRTKQNEPIVCNKRYRQNLKLSVKGTKKNCPTGGQIYQDKSSSDEK